MDIALPRIEPAQAVRSGADNIDRAGAEFKRTADAIANIITEDKKASIAVQTQEAALQATKGIDETMHVIKSNPYINPDNYLGTGKTLEEVLGGTPRGMDVTEQVPGQADPNKRQRRKVIPMHEVAPALFDHMTGTVTLAAQQNIEDAPWQRHFARAMAKDVEAKRAEMLDWQRAQRLADAEIRTKSQLQQAAANRNWTLYTAILDTPENQLGVQERQAFRENLPILQTQAAVEDRLRSRDIADIEKLRSDIMGNVVSPESGFATKLTADQQYHFTKLADERVREIQHEEEWQRKRAEEKRFEDFGDVVQQAVNAARVSGRPLSSIVSVSDIPVEMGFHNFITYKNFIDAMDNKERKTDPRAWLDLAGKEKDGSLGKMSKAQVMAYWPYLSEDHQRTWMDRWASAKKGALKPLFTADEEKLMDVYLRNKGFDDKKNADEFETAKAQLQQNLSTWRAKNPDVPLLYNVLKTEGNLATFNTPTPRWYESSKVSNWVRKNLGDTDTQSALSLALGAVHPGVTVTVQEMEDHARQIEREAPVVDEAWSALNPAQALTGSARAIVHGVLTNPVEIARVDSQLGGKEKNERNRIYQIVQNMQIPQSREQAAQNEAKARVEAEGRQVRAAGATLRAEQDARPAWERQADITEKDALKDSDNQVYEQILGRLQSEARKANQMKPWYASRFGSENEVVSAEMEKRARAEAAETEKVRHASIQEDFAVARARYRAIVNDYQRGDPEAVRLMSTGPYQSFAVWFGLWKQGKVR